MRIVRAISIRQPYAEQILRRLKREEFRSISTRIRERVWIYASERPADDPAACRHHAETEAAIRSYKIQTVEVTGELNQIIDLFVLMDLPAIIEKVLVEHGIMLHLNRRMKKYFAEE